MSKIRRRKVLKYGAIASVASLAGCSGNGNGGNGNGGNGNGGDGNGNGGNGNGNGNGGTTGNGDDGGGYPNENITLISNYPEGSTTYGYAIKLGSVISEQQGINVEVEAVGGGAGLRGLGELRSRPADGYTFSTAYTPSQPLAALINDPGFDVTNLTGITDGGHYTWNIISDPEMEFDSFDGMVDRYNDGEFDSIGGLGFGHSWHVGCAWIRDQIEGGWDWQNLVSFDGSNDSVRGTAAGEVPVSTASTSAVPAAVEEGQIDVLANMSSSGDQYAPNAPAWVDDLGYFNMDFLGNVSYAFLAPPDVDSEIRSQAVDVFEQAITSDEMAQWAEEGDRHIYVDYKAEEVNQLMSDTQDQVQENLDLEALVE